MAEQQEGYVLAKLEAIESTIDQLREENKGMQLEVRSLASQIQEYTAQWKAVRWLGGVLLGLVVFVKTGSLEAFKEVFN